MVRAVIIIMRRERAWTFNAFRSVFVYLLKFNDSPIKDECVYYGIIIRYSVQQFETIKELLLTAVFGNILSAYRVECGKSIIAAVINRGRTVCNRYAAGIIWMAYNGGCKSIMSVRRPELLLQL